MSVDQEFDQGIGGRLRSASSAPPADLWDDIEARLPEERRRRPLAIWWLSGVAAVVIAVGAGSAGLYHTTEDTPRSEVRYGSDTRAPMSRLPSTAAPQPRATDLTTPVAPPQQRAKPAVGSGSIVGLGERPDSSSTRAVRQHQPPPGPLAARVETQFLPNASIAFELLPGSTPIETRIGSRGDTDAKRAEGAAALPYPTMAAFDLQPPGINLDIPSLTATGSPAWRWSARAGVSYLMKVVSEGAYETRGAYEAAGQFSMDNGLNFVAESNIFSKANGGKPLVPNRAALPLGYAAQVSLTSRRGLRFEGSVASAQTQTSFATILLRSGGIAALATTNVPADRRSAQRLVLGGSVGYAPRLGRWTPSLMVGAGWTPARRLAIEIPEALASVVYPLGSQKVYLRQRVFAKAALGIDYALNPKLDIGVDYSLGGLGSSAGVGVRYSW